MACSTGCINPGSHATWGECVRGKALHIGDLKGHETNKKWDSDLDAYASARRQGIQPAGIERDKVDAAVQVSEAIGGAVDA